jgi:CBS-domain-containing membrane protein
LPVLNGRKCVGLVEKATYYLHIPSTIGTDLETARDLAVLKKRALQIMNPLFEQVGESVTISDVVGDLQQGKRPPWVVVNEEGRYLGLIEQDNILSILVQP